MSDEHAVAINEAYKISIAEHAALRAAMLDEQIGSDGGTYCAGFTISSGECGGVFAPFQWLSE